MKAKRTKFLMPDLPSLLRLDKLSHWSSILCLLVAISSISCARKAIVVGDNVVMFKGSCYGQELDSTNFFYQKVRFNPIDDQKFSTNTNGNKKDS